VRFQIILLKFPDNILKMEILPFFAKARDYSQIILKERDMYTYIFSNPKLFSLATIQLIKLAIITAKRENGINCRNNDCTVRRDDSRDRKSRRFI